VSSPLLFHGCRWTGDLWKIKWVLFWLCSPIGRTSFYFYGSVLFSIGFLIRPFFPRDSSCKWSANIPWRVLSQDRLSSFSFPQKSFPFLGIPPIALPTRYFSPPEVVFRYCNIGERIFFAFTPFFQSSVSLLTSATSFSSLSKQRCSSYSSPQES